MLAIEDHIKAYYRRGVARMNLEMYDKALEDFEKVISMDPG